VTLQVFDFALQLFEFLFAIVCLHVERPASGKSF
jgi:hypothetical protein